MNRALVALLSALDALIQAAIGLAVVAATVAVLFAFGGTGAWAALWPATAAIWQLGELVPLGVTLPDDLAVRLGIGADAAAFAVSLPPLALTAFTVLFGVRSGARAARAGAWATGAAAALVTSAAIAAAVWATAATTVVRTEPVWAVAAPALLYAGAVLAGGVATAWRVGDDGVVDAVREGVGRWSWPWPVGIAAGVRGGAAAVLGLVAVSGVGAAVAVVAGGGEIVSLFQAGGADVVGVIVLMLAQLAYLPTAIVWAMSWLAGPGFALGAGTTVNPAGNDVGVLPGIPLLGAVPEASGTWLLLVVLVPVAAGAVAGLVARSALVRADATDPFGARLIATALTAVIAAGAASVLCLAASGSFGPGVFAHVGPSAGWVALAVGAEVLVGAGVLLLAPRPEGLSTGRWGG